MPAKATSGWGAEFDRITHGELPSSTEARLKELVGWGGSTSFLTPRALSAAADAGIHPIGQVVGLSAGAVLTGYVRTTRAGQSRVRGGAARWRERTGPLKSWTALRQRALARLAKQATLLGADAVIGVKAERDVEHAPEGAIAQVRFAGTAVRIEAWRQRATPPVLTLASAQELWSMLRGGIEPAGIAGGFARGETVPSTATVVRSLGARRLTPNMELEDLTRSVYEARRLALERLVADARTLKADGLLGIELAFEEEAPGLTVHVLASAVRRVAPSRIQPEPILTTSNGARG